MKTIWVFLLAAAFSLSAMAQLSPPQLKSMLPSAGSFQKMKPTDCECDVVTYNDVGNGFFIDFTQTTESSYDGFNECSYSAGVFECGWLHVRNNSCLVTVVEVRITIYQSSGASTFGINDAYTQWGNCCWRDKWTATVQEGNSPTLTNCNEYSWSSLDYDANQDDEITIIFTPPDASYYILPDNHFMVSICGAQAIDVVLVHSTAPTDVCNYSGLVPTTNQHHTCSCEATTSCRGQEPPLCPFEL